jgi:hypothetical protein
VYFLIFFTIYLYDRIELSVNENSVAIVYILMSSEEESAVLSVNESNIW